MKTTISPVRSRLAKIEKGEYIGKSITDDVFYITRVIAPPSPTGLVAACNSADNLAWKLTIPKYNYVKIFFKKKSAVDHACSWFKNLQASFQN